MDYKEKVYLNHHLDNPEKNNKRFKQAGVNLTFSMAEINHKKLQTTR